MRERECKKSRTNKQEREIKRMQKKKDDDWKKQNELKITGIKNKGKEMKDKVRIKGRERRKNKKQGRKYDSSRWQLEFNFLKIPSIVKRFKQ